MIIAIPVDEEKNDVCVSFGRAPYFLFYNTENKKTEILENLSAEAQGGAGIKAAQFVVDNNADVLITIRCGENSADVLKAAEIEIYKADKKLAIENIKAFMEGKLTELTSFHAGYHGKI